MNEQLEVRISGRDFGISLKGYNEQANKEIRELFANKGDTDLLALLRAYLDVVHKKCELEYRIQKVDSRIDMSMQKHALLEQAKQEALQEEIVKEEIAQEKQEQVSQETIKQDSARDIYQSHKTLDMPISTQRAISLFDELPSTQEHLAHKDTIA
ncbi:Uncharacterised protein [Helicobacter canis]|uniref:Uncharacterized protein n=2 Tax=Helicobacter canis TaxID=29419 RepID=A0A377J4D4_9HELI|nr:Uncharacterised protein [Helicobacter canis]